MNKLAITIDGETFEVEVRRSQESADEFIAVVNGEELPIWAPEPGPPGDMDWLVIGNRPYELVFHPDLEWIGSHGGHHRVQVRDLEATTARPVSGDGRVKAPIPGLITRIMVEPGAHVETGQPLLVLEAMKMENEIRSPRSGVVAQLKVQPGQTVMLNELLIEVN